MCRGAHIAHEMAIRLKQEGQEVALVGILDTWVLENTYNSFWYLEYYYRRLKSLRRLGLREQLEFLKKKAKGMASRFGSWAKTAPSENSAALSKNPHEVYFPGEKFVPTTYAGPVTVFRVRKQPLNRIRDAQLGWHSIAAGGVDLHFIPGKHGTVLREPNVQGLAEELKKCLLTESANEADTLPTGTGRSAALVS
jgi:aspartate racemase